jgi:secreted trypsin-like serine protease
MDLSFVVDIRARGRLMRAMGRALICLLLSCWPAAAMVGGATAPPDSIARALVLIVGSRGNFCTGAALAPDLVLTAAHCVLPGADYKIVEYERGEPRLRDVTRVAAHPQFSAQSLLAHRATADVALLKVAAPLSVTPASLGPTPTVAPGDTFLVAGLGVAVRGEGKSGGTARAARLIATGRPGNLQIRLVDAATMGEREGLGACTGDSGAPVFANGAIVGVVSWSTGPRNSAGCGGLTGVTPLALYRSWVTDSAKLLGNKL